MDDSISASKIFDRLFPMTLLRFGRSTFPLQFQIVAVREHLSLGPSEISEISEIRKTKEVLSFCWNLLLFF